MNGTGWQVRQQEELISAVKQISTQMVEITKLLQTISRRLPVPTQK
jgi:hypothetical protein